MASCAYCISFLLKLKLTIENITTVETLVIFSMVNLSWKRLLVCTLYIYFEWIIKYRFIGEYVRFSKWYVQGRPGGGAGGREGRVGADGRQRRAPLCARAPRAAGRARARARRQRAAARRHRRLRAAARAGDVLYHGRCRWCLRAAQVCIFIHFCVLPDIVMSDDKKTNEKRESQQLLQISRSTGALGECELQFWGE